MNNYISDRGVYYDKEKSPHTLVVEGFTFKFSSIAKLNSYQRKLAQRVLRAKKIVRRFEIVAGPQPKLLQNNMKYIIHDVYKEVEPQWQ